MNTPIYEQETIIRWYRDEERAAVYTSDFTVMTKLDKLTETSDDWELGIVSTFPDGTVEGKTYSCPKKLISFRSKTITRNLTDEERAELSRSNWRLLAGLADFGGVILGTAAILVLIALLVSLMNWLINDISQTFILLQTQL